MTIKKIFKCTKGDCNYVTLSGKYLHFKEGKYITADNAEITELTMEIKNGHPYFYIDPLEVEIDTTLQDKIKEARDRAEAEVLAEHNAAGLSAKNVKADVDKLVPQLEAVNKVVDSTLVANAGANSALAALSNAVQRNPGSVIPPNANPASAMSNSK